MIKLLKQFISYNSEFTGGKNHQTKNHQTISWVIPGKLAVGSLPRSGFEKQLAEANIKTILSLCDRHEGILPAEITDNFQCIRLVLPDRHYETEITAEQINQAVEIIHHSLKNNQAVYVHCLAGIERSPTVCIAYLCRYNKLELWEAFNWLKEVHPRSQPSPAGVRALREFSK